MRNISFVHIAILAGLVAILLPGCQKAGGNFQGKEYMPDMAHSIAYESNHYLYYHNNTWGGEEAYREMAGPRKPVANTVARGQSKYIYGDLEMFRTAPDETWTKLRDNARLAAMNDADLVNPLPMIKEGPEGEKELNAILEDGKHLYDIYCAVCHGEKGDGNGVLYNGGNGPYSVGPANYLSAEFKEAADSRFYSAIMIGKGQMLSHADKLNEKERWMVIHYIRSLQAADAGTAYDLAAIAQAGNTVVEEPTVTGEEEGEIEETE